MNPVCLCVCPFFHEPPKVPASWHFGFRPNLGLKTWQSPIFLFLIFKGVPIWSSIKNPLDIGPCWEKWKFQPFQHIGQWYFNKVNISIQKKYNLFLFFFNPFSGGRLYKKKIWSKKCYTHFRWKWNFSNKNTYFWSAPWW